jgi:enoyl-CoA hydratase/carnithine racemase
VRRTSWNHDRSAVEQLEALLGQAREPGFLRVDVESGGGGALSWTCLEPWTRSRAVTVAVIDGTVASPGLEVALCSDLVFVRPCAVLELAAGAGPPAAGVVWALGRAGRAALARGLLDSSSLTADEAVALGLAQATAVRGEELPLPEGFSQAAVTTARDLMRASATAGPGLALELASFRLLFASGDPNEGGRAFLEKREPEF